MADAVDQRGLGLIADLSGQSGTFVALGGELHLDQLMGIECRADLGQYGVRQPMLADPDHWLQMVSEAPQVSSLAR